MAWETHHVELWLCLLQHKLLQALLQQTTWARSATSRWITDLLKSIKKH
jgi:hypothetical protein